MTYTHKQQVTDLVLASKKNFLLLFCEVLFQALLLFVPEKSAQAHLKFISVLQHHQHLFSFM